VTQLPDYRPVEIYDRNFGKDDLNYQFPAEYQPFIVGNLPFEEIDKAYKGYHYAINLNSIKQSQTMFARRVYELLASNTVTVSNFSRGIRLMFGDLVVVSDSGEEVLERVKEISQTPEKLRKHKLLALRKVMSEHTYQDRFAYIVSKVQGHQVSSWHPHVVVVGYAKGDAQFKSIVANFKRQVFDNKKLYIVVPNNSLVEQVSQSEKIQDSAIKIVTLSDLNDISMGEWLESFDWFAAMVPDDYYGVNYLMDLVLATRYVQSSLIAKSTHYVLTSNHELKLAWPNRQYKFIQACPVRSTLIKVTLLKAESAREWLKDIYTKEYKATEAYQAFAIDEFNYCKNTGSEPLQKVTENVDDLTGLNVGIGIDDLLHKAEKIQPAEVLADSAPVWSTEKLSTLFKTPKSNKAEVTVNELGLHIKSNLQDGQNEYIYATQDFTLDELGYSKETPFFLDTTPGLNIQLVILFLDANKQRISHVIKHANRNQNAEIPLGTEYIRLGLRIYAGGEADVKALVLGHRPLLPSEVVGQSDHLLLTNNYPSYDDLYRNGFVHSRVVAYKEQGIDVDVYRLRKDEAISYHEFKNINVMTGSQQALDKLLKNGSYKSILVHFLDPDMWHVLKNYINKVKVYVWVHGADIQAWHRRAFNYDTEEQRANAKKQSDIRLSFWRSLLTDKHPNLKLVFVSKYSAESSMEDLGIQLNKSAYEIIHNPIDMDLFNYVPKPVEQRKKILSIRPYASKVYANDLTVKVILELAKEPFFKELEFRLIGDGVLFDEIVEPLRGFDNVIIEKKFLQQKEIAELHKQYGIFLCPTRMDSQGVSRDEAMSSGLVPVTNNVAAIPEFVDMDSGVLANAENYMELAVGIVELFNNPDKFSELSSNASNIVRNKSVKELIVSTEINFFKIALKDENP
jgi:glycosyltransferase involved in cell wall biosynthesis